MQNLFLGKKNIDTWQSQNLERDAFLQEPNSRHGLSIKIESRVQQVSQGLCISVMLVLLPEINSSTPPPPQPQLAQRNLSGCSALQTQIILIFKCATDVWEHRQEDSVYHSPLWKCQKSKRSPKEVSPPGDVLVGGLGASQSFAGRDLLSSRQSSL